MEVGKVPAIASDDFEPDLDLLFDLSFDFLSTPFPVSVMSNGLSFESLLKMRSLALNLPAWIQDQSATECRA